MTSRLLLVDDHPLFRAGLRTLLNTIDGFEVVGEGASAGEAVALAAELEPDVILMDLQMPGGSGISATREILRVDPSSRILVVTLFEDDESVFMALRAGARGYLLKDAQEDDIIRAIRAVGAGEAIFSPAVATRVLRYLSGVPADVPTAVFPTLTPRERGILERIAAGRANRAIAGELAIAPKTVANNVSNIFAKLQVADRAEAIVLARDAGYGRKNTTEP